MKWPKDYSRSTSASPHSPHPHGSPVESAKPQTTDLPRPLTLWYFLSKGHTYNFSRSANPATSLPVWSGGGKTPYTRKSTPFFQWLWSLTVSDSVNHPSISQLPRFLRLRVPSTSRYIPRLSITCKRLAPSHNQHWVTTEAKDWLTKPTQSQILTEEHSGGECVQARPVIAAMFAA